MFGFIGYLLILRKKHNVGILSEFDYQSDLCGKYSVGIFSGNVFILSYFKTGGYVNRIGICGYICSDDYSTSKLGNTSLFPQKIIKNHLKTPPDSVRGS